MNTDTQVQAVLDYQPDLHIWGNGDPGFPEFEFHAARNELLKPSTLLGIQATTLWCNRHLVSSRPNKSRDRSTYYWKHVYERHTNGIYIPNGAFAVAAALAGLPMDWSEYNPTIHARESRHHPIEGRRD
ncbi:hypothetical protein WBN73_05545 [Paenarthrobacter sp. CCNWLY172]|uniref:hypothetical protein n=1 Tax=unclassified Paenarthrobacter TaxID=2634190 RepID=UPI0030780878